MVQSYSVVNQGWNFYRKILPFPWKSIERVYLSIIICACPRLCEMYGLVEIGNILAIPSQKCLKYLPVQNYFYLSRTGEQSVISIPDSIGNKEK